MPKEVLHIEKRGRNVKPPHLVQHPPPIKGERECLISGVFGLTGVGKSHQTKIEIKNKFIQPTNPKLVPRKMLIFDTNGEYTGIQEISLFNIKKWTEPVCKRVIGTQFDSAEKKKAAALYCASNFRNGGLLIDDIDKFAAYNREQDLVGLFMGNRHVSVDLIIAHQSLEMASPNFWRNVTSVRLHYQFSEDKNLKERSKGSFDILKIAEMIIENQYRNVNNKRFFLTINIRDRKIYGCSDVNAFVRACYKFLNLYPVYVKYEIAEHFTRNPDLKIKKTSNEAWQIGQEMAFKKLSVFYSAENP